MRIVVRADSHGAGSPVMKIVEKNIYTADLFIHLGDGEEDMLGVLLEYPEINLIQIKGNCDLGSASPEFRIIETVPGPDDKEVKILAVHGHLQNVNRGTDELLRLAHENDCGIVLFGHTHRRCEINEGGVTLINPGSCSLPRDGSSPSYAFIDITEWGKIIGISDIPD